MDIVKMHNAYKSHNTLLFNILLVIIVNYYDIFPRNNSSFF